MKASRSSAALKPERAGVLAVAQEQQTIDRLQGICRDMQLDDELVIVDTVDAALRRIRSGQIPRVLLLDLADSTAPIAEVSSARTVGGADLKIVALGALNDVALFRDLLGRTKVIDTPSSARSQLHQRACPIHIGHPLFALQRVAIESA